MITVYYLLIVVFVLSQRRVLRSFFLSLTPLSLSARHKLQAAGCDMRQPLQSQLLHNCFSLSLLSLVFGGDVDVGVIVVIISSQSSGSYVVMHCKLPS